MGILDSVRDRLSTAVNRVQEAVAPAVEKVEKAASEVGHAAASTFEASAPAPRPSAPPPAVSSNPTVSARSLALSPSLLRNDLTVATASPAAAGGSPDAQAEALIKKHTSSLGNLYEENLGDELADMARKDPTAAAAVIKAVFNKLGPSDVDDVACEFVKVGPDVLRKLAQTPDGTDALEKAKKELGTGVVDSDDKKAIASIEQAQAEAAKPQYATEKQAALASLTYAANGEKTFSLNDPEAVKKLIANSPQLDDLTTTTTDETRCGGGAMLNAMLLSGDPAANAKAITATASKLGVTPKPAESAALDAMSKGTMTPHQAAQLQELLVRMEKTPRPEDQGKPGFKRGGDAGVSMQGMADFVSLIRAEGGLANAKSITFHMEGNHWTTEVKGKDGNTTGANSWPDTGGVGSTMNHLPEPTTSFNDFVLENNADQTVSIGARGTVFVPDPENGGFVQVKTPIMNSSNFTPKGGDMDFVGFMRSFAKQRGVLPENLG